MHVKKILIGSELDEFSAKVTAFAVSLAEQLNISEVVLLNLITPEQNQANPVLDNAFADGKDMGNRINKVLMEKHRRLAKKEAKKFSTYKVKIKALTRFNDSITDVNKYMEDHGSELIVCGSGGKHNFLQLVFGSQPGKMGPKVDYPLIILQDEAEAGEIHSILVAIDINKEDQSVLKNISHLAKDLNAKMQLLHVLTDDSHSSDQAIKILRQLAINNMLAHYDINVVNNDSLENGIGSFARQHNPDMIAVSSQGKGKIHKLIFGSSTKAIIKETDKPVYISKIS